MEKAALFSFLLFGLVAVTMRFAEAQKSQCPAGVNLLKTCRCPTDGFGICWDEECTLCDEDHRMKRYISGNSRPRPLPGGRPRPGDRPLPGGGDTDVGICNDCGPAQFCHCLIGYGCCCLWDNNC